METIKTRNNNLRYVIYARKSSESEDRQALSIQSQIIEMKEIAKREKLKIIKIFQEAKSAKEPGRPIFNEMVQTFKRNQADGILCWKIDRLARNPVDEGIIKWLLQKETIRKIKTFDRDYNPEDNVVMASIEFGMATQYIRDLSRNVKRGLAEKVRRGEYPGSPPAGYVSNYKTKRLILDSKKWNYVKEAFRLYATGMYSVQSLAKKLNEDGLRTVGEKLFFPSGIHTMLTNPIYYGWFRWNDQIHKGTHPAIVSRGLFDQVQEVLFPRRHSKRDNKREFTFRGFMTCGECGLKITAEVKKGHTYYRCTKSHGPDKCSQRYIREEDLIEEMKCHFAKLQCDREILDIMIETAKESGEKDWKHCIEIEKKNKYLLDRNLALQNSLVEKFIDNHIPEDIYNRKLAEFRNEEAVIEGKLRSAKENYRSVFESIELVARFLKRAPEIFEKGKDEERKLILSIISSNISIKDREIKEFKLAMPFNLLMEDLKNAKLENGENTAFEPLFFAKTTPKRVVQSSRLPGQDSNL